jgi:hypothetical protein
MAEQQRTRSQVATSSGLATAGAISTSNKREEEGSNMTPPEGLILPLVMTRGGE